LRDAALELVISEEALSETTHEIQRRVNRLIARGSMSHDDAHATLEVALDTVHTSVEFVSRNIYAPYLDEARRRVPRDPNDAPTVALALAFGYGIWTNDYDFFGCGVATWTTETILRHLAAGDDGSVIAT
jgi:predicted nucleic acid-binding protein